MQSTKRGIVAVGVLAYLISLFSRWFIVNNQYLAPLVVWFWHLSLFGIIPRSSYAISGAYRSGAAPSPGMIGFFVAVSCPLGRSL
eukprot:2088843-Rhodomonas_salina.1